MNVSELSRASLDWLDDRTGVRSALRSGGTHTVSGNAYLTSFWPSLIVFVFLIELITGLVLWMYYTPSAQTAWESVYYIQHQVTGGWLVRGIHHYAAQVLVGLLMLYVLQLVLFGLYRRSRELVFWVAVFLGLTAAALCLTGDLLSWGENSYAATQTRVRFLMLLPGIGAPLFKLAAGGTAFGHLTLARFFTLHVGVFTGAFFVLLVLHGWFQRRAAIVEGVVTQPARAYWPRQFLINAVGCVAVMAVVLLLVLQHRLTGEVGERPISEWAGAPLGAPADPNPANAYGAARPEWSFRSLYELTHMFSGQWQMIPIFVLPTLVMGYVLAMPLIGKRLPGHLLNLVVLALLIGGAGWLTKVSYQTDAADPDYVEAVDQGRTRADRVVQLAQHRGVPTTGALTLLQTDPKLQGPRLFEQHCAACHVHAPPDAERLGPDVPSAPELTRFASREWITGLLDPDTVDSDRYYGNTRFAAGIMVTYVKSHLAEVDAQQRAAIAAALSAEAQLGYQAQQDQDQALIAQGQAAIVQEGCVRCHRFHDQGENGQAPDLTGYGSHEWLTGMIANPAHPWFYQVRNDRMPAYVETPEDPLANRLPPAQLDTLVRWLRYEWYEPALAAAGADRASSPPPALLTLGKWAARDDDPSDPAPQSARDQALAIMQLAQCTLCHDYTDADGQGLPAHAPIAPSLAGFASRAWLTGILDPEQVAGPKYFGNNENFAEGEMVDYVQNTLPDMFAEVGEAALEALVEEAVEKGAEQAFAVQYLTDLKEEIGEAELNSRVQASVDEDTFADFVSEQADDTLHEKLGRQRLELLIEALAEESRRDQALDEIDEQTIALFDDFYCSDCHKFYDTGDLGSAPDLTGYGSQAWLTELITNVETERFYEFSNDGMPAYHAFPDQPQKNLLSEEQIRQLAELLRGQLD